MMGDQGTIHNIYYNCIAINSWPSFPDTKIAFFINRFYTRLYFWTTYWVLVLGLMWEIYILEPCG